METKGTQSRGSLYYGRYILAASFAILFFDAGARYSFGVMFKPMISEFGWSRGSVSLVFFINTAIYAFSLLLVGRFYDRYGPKWVIISTTIFLSVGYSLTSTVDSLWQFSLFYGVFAAMGLGGTSLPLFSSLISKWFEKWRGLAISLALSGNCLGQFVLVPFFTVFTLKFGWRTSYLFIGIVMLFVNLTLALWVIKGDPVDLSKNPFRDPNIRIKEEKSNSISSEMHPKDFRLWEAMTTSSFWFYTMAMFICGSGDFFVATHLIPMVTDQGISPITGGNMLAWYGLMGLVGIIIAGSASDLIGNKWPIAITFLLRVFSFLLILKYQNVISFYVFSLTFGLTYLVTAPLTATLLGSLYGFSHIGFISGFVTTIHHLGGGFWAYLGGWAFDKTGSYQIIFALSAMLALVAFIFTLLIKERRHVRS